MNNENPPYTIGLIGFEISERRALRRVVDMAESRRPSFKPFDKDRGGCPHLVLVDADRLSAMRGWHRFRRANAHRASFSPIFVGRTLTDLPCPDPYVLQRPVLATRLFSVLDQAVAEVHGFRPAASILDGVVAETRHDIDTTMETTTVLGAAADASLAESGESSRTQRVPGINALVVDDSLPVRVQMRGVLSSIASHVDFAATGKQALELIDAHRYSMIFIDGVLPDEHAFEICARIRKHPLQQDAAVVMLTSNPSPPDRVMGMLAGFDNYLTKPIQREMFDGLAATLMRPAAAI